MPMAAAGNALVAVDKVMVHGDVKYGENRWTQNPSTPEEVDKHLDAAMRHIARYRTGQMIDESGEPSLAHVAARTIMALEHFMRQQSRL